MYIDLIRLRVILYLNVIDWGTTFYGVETGLMREANPVMVHWVERGAWFTVLLIKVSLILTIMFWRYHHKSPSTIVRYAINFILAMYIIIVTRSVFALSFGFIIV